MVDMPHSSVIPMGRPLSLPSMNPPVPPVPLGPRALLRLLLAPLRDQPRSSTLQRLALLPQSILLPATLRILCAGQRMTSSSIHLDRLPQKLEHSLQKTQVVVMYTPPTAEQAEGCTARTPPVGVREQVLSLDPCI